MAASRRRHRSRGFGSDHVDTPISGTGGAGGLDERSQRGSLMSGYPYSPVEKAPDDLVVPPIST